MFKLPYLSSWLTKSSPVFPEINPPTISRQQALDFVRTEKVRQQDLERARQKMPDSFRDSLELVPGGYVRTREKSDPLWVPAFLMMRHPFNRGQYKKYLDHFSYYSGGLSFLFAKRPMTKLDLLRIQRMKGDMKREIDCSKVDFNFPDKGMYIRWADYQYYLRFETKARPTTSVKWERLTQAEMETKNKIDPKTTLTTSLFRDDFGSMMDDATGFFFLLVRSAILLIPSILDVLFGFCSGPPSSSGLTTYDGSLSYSSSRLGFRFSVTPKEKS